MHNLPETKQIDTFKAWHYLSYAENETISAAVRNNGQPRLTTRQDTRYRLFYVPFTFIFLAN
jgi:hypothetical protein